MEKMERIYLGAARDGKTEASEHETAGYPTAFFRIIFPAAVSSPFPNIALAFISQTIHIKYEVAFDQSDRVLLKELAGCLHNPPQTRPSVCMCAQEVRSYLDKTGANPDAAKSVRLLAVQGEGRAGAKFRVKIGSGFCTGPRPHGHCGPN